MRTDRLAPRARALTHLLMAAALAAGCQRESVESLDTEAAVPVTVESAKIETFYGTVSASGTITPAPGAELTVIAPASARVAELPKAEGDPVAAGDLLVRFDIPGFAADLSARRAAVAQASARVENARASYARLSGLLAQGVAARRDVEDARRQQAEAEADLDQATSAVAAATAVLDRATVRAPFAGVVARRFHNPGDLVDAAAGDPILRLINTSALQVVAAVPVSDLHRISVGRRATVVPAGASDGLDARVVATAAEVDANSATANVRLALTARSRLAVGTPVRVDIVAEERPKALVIPAAAIVEEARETFVMVAGDDHKAHRRPITAGLVSRGLAEVTAGLSAGDRVIVRGQDALPDGAAVTVTP